MSLTDRKLRGAVAGLLATVAMSVLMLAGMLTGIAPMPEPIPKALAAIVLGGAPKPALMGAAILGHLGYGAAWGAALFATVDGAGTREGLGLGVGLWVLMGLLVLPALGWGLFGTGLDPRIAVATLVLHLVYGATIAPAFEALTPTSTTTETPGAPGA